MGLMGEFSKGVWKENPNFRVLLGFCPTLAVSTQVPNAFGMGAAATFVLLFSNIFISLLRNQIPRAVRIPAYIMIIAAFVTLVDLTMQAYFPVLSKNLGIFIPLIVVNCIIMGRAEAFACRNSILPSVMDALGMGLGFTLSLTVLSTIREVLGNGTFYGIPVLGSDYIPVIVMILPPGAFLALGLILGFMNWYDARSRARKRKAAAEEPA